MSRTNAVEGIYVVTDTRIQGRYNHKELAKYAAEGGAAAVQFRDKRMGAARKFEVLKNIQSICDKYGCTSIVNNRVDLQMASEAGGVHLGQQDLPIEQVRKLVGEDVLIGGTASTLSEAKSVEQAGADYVGFGHIFVTATKQKDYPPRGIEKLVKVVSEISIPVVAIGGITRSNAAKVIKTGVEGVAVTSAVCNADNPLQAVGELAQIYEDNRLK